LAIFSPVILRSKIHSPLSDSTLGDYAHRQVSGELISTPVNYIQKGKTIYISQKTALVANLRGGATVTYV